MSEFDRPYGRMEIASSLDRALEHAKRMMFRSFDIVVWLSIGLMAFLESLALGGGGGGSGYRSFGNMGGSSPSGQNAPGDGMSTVNQRVQDAMDWVGAHLPIILGVAAVILLLFLGLMLLFLWLGSRGHMMLIRAVASADADLGRNWREVKGPANAVFRFLIVYALVSFVLMIGLAGVLVAQVVWIASQKPESITAYLFPLVPTGLALFLMIIVLGLVKTLQRNFVSPLMLHFNLTAGPAWRLFRTISRGNRLAIFFFLLIKMAYFVGFAFAAALVGCVTCCIGLLPVIQQSIFAPFYVFDRAFGLFMLAGLGPEYQMIQPEPQPYDVVAPYAAPPEPPVAPEPPSPYEEPPRDDSFDNPFRPDEPDRS